MRKRDPEWSARIRKLRVDRNLNQAQIARALGITQMTVSNYESCDSMPGCPEFVEKLISGLPKWDTTGDDYPSEGENPAFDMKVSELWWCAYRIADARSLMTECEKYNVAIQSVSKRSRPAKDAYVRVDDLAAFLSYLEQRFDDVTNTLRVLTGGCGVD